MRGHVEGMSKIECGNRKESRPRGAKRRTEAKARVIGHEGMQQQSLKKMKRVSALQEEREREAWGGRESRDSCTALLTAPAVRPERPLRTNMPGLSVCSMLIPSLSQVSPEGGCE